MENTTRHILKESEISDLVINSLPGVFYLHDENGNYLRWNKNLEVVSGYTAEEIRKLKPIDFFEAGNHQRITNVIRKVFDEGAADIAIEAITKDGRKVPFYLNGKAVNYEGKLCLIGMGINISARVNAEKENKKNESILQALFDNVGGSVFLLDTQKRLVVFNNELTKTYKVLAGKEPVPGELAYSFLPPDEMKKRHDILDSALRGKKEVIEVVYERNGEKIFYRSGFNPVIVDGKVTGISCYTIDITSVKKAELETQKAQERLNYHINNSPLVVIEYDKDLEINFWSKRAAEIYGWTEEEVMGRKITEFLVHTDDINIVQDNLLAHDNTQERTPLSNRNYTKDGRVLHCRWHSSFLADEFGNVNTVMSIIRDITDLWKAEKQREEMANDLVKRNNDLEQFTYIVSHNLRAPIASLIGLADILSQMDLSEDEKKEIIAGISHSAHRLDDVIKDLNDILHLKNSYSESKEVVSFSQLVSEIEQNILYYYSKDKFVIETDFSAVDNYYTLKHYLSSIFSNLISNSIKYRHPDKDPFISISSELNERKLTLIFKDNGMGIDLDKTGGDVFGLYKRFHYHVEGKGLGLFMVKAQVETLGGSRSVASEVNRGAEFRIEFDV